MVTREEALELLRKYNKSESHINHALSVEATMKAFAEKRGENPQYWSIVGLLHDIDWELYPEEHCKKAPELLKEIDMQDDQIRAICSHGWGICCDIEPEREMEKILYTIDELTGLVYATALMRPEHMNGMSVKSVKKKWKTPSFAAGVNREIIQKGSEMCGIEIAELIQTTIDAMSAIAPEIGL